VSRFLAASTGERSVRSLNETAHLREGDASLATETENPPR
jgi:hypothetical protein